MIAGAAGPARASETPTLRLPQTVRPVRYALEATIDPAADTYSGRIDIDLNVTADTDVLWLQAVDLEISGATVGGGAAETRQSGDFLGVKPVKPLPVGQTQLHLEFKAKLLDGTQAGFFRAREGKNAYVFSKLESIFARRAFPCFDEPGFKTPWRITLHVRKEHIALANSPVASEKDDAGGLKTVTFAESRPLPTYLVAIAVGPFELVDAGKAGKKGTPVRIVVPTGMSKEAAYAAKVAPEILARLERYFDLPYPYDKLDLAALPGQPGAMENAGLITFGTRRILADPARQTNEHRRSVAHIMAHEMAHLWFGDHVTMSWWDDIWLNEGFATWLGEKVVAEWKPEWREDAGKARSRAKAMSADALASARQVRQPIETPDDIFNAFDAITYEKGASVLAMIEAWIGPDSFQKGVKTYLQAHADGNATTADFVASMSDAAGLDIGPVLSSFVDQPGSPVVTVDVRCDKGTPRVSLTQARYARAGVPRSDKPATWRIPICVKYGAAAGTARACMLLTGVHAELLLDETKVCPDWVMGNDGGVGYYRVRTSDERIAERVLREPALSLRERITAFLDLGGQVDDGNVPAATALRSLPALASDRDPLVAAEAAEMAWRLASKPFVVPEMEERWAKLLEKTFGDRARRLGFKPARGEDEDVQRLRDELVTLVAIEGRDKRLTAEARALAKKWLDNRKSVDADAARNALWIAARTGERELYEMIRAEAARPQEPNDRAMLLASLVSFGDPVLLRRGLENLLGDDVSGGEAVTALNAAAKNDVIGQAVVREWVRQTFDVLARKLPVQFRPYLFGVGGGCDEPSRRKHEQFFSDKVTQIAGAKRILAQALEGMDTCIAARKVEEASVTGFLRGQ